MHRCLTRVVVALACLTGFARAQDAGKSEPIRIGVLAPLDSPLLINDRVDVALAGDFIRSHF